MKGIDLTDPKIQPAAYVSLDKTLYLVMSVDVSDKPMGNHIWLEDAHSVWSEKAKSYKNYTIRKDLTKELIKKLVLAKAAPAVEAVEDKPKEPKEPVKAHAGS